MGEHLKLQQPPEPSPGHALFLDFDGTLVEIADAPDLISVPSELPSLLNRVSESLGDRLAVVSGRSMRALRGYLPEARFELVGEHGASLDPKRGGWPRDWEPVLREAERNLSDVVVERKHLSIAFHYRRNPSREIELLTRAEALRGIAGPDYEITSSNSTIEVKRKDANKAAAIAVLLARPNFAGRIPIFVADDESDRLGFEAVERVGGIALHVGAAFDGKPQRVREWLAGYTRLKS
jgi:trehalose 6-phosphate phosphatase